MLGKPRLRLFDVAANLTDPSFEGVYHGKKKHESDLERVVERARAVGCDKFLVAAGNIGDFQRGKGLWREGMFLTAGVHPCRANEAAKDARAYMRLLEEEIQACPPGRLVAIGECGLDYDRLDYSSKEDQL
jgi:TatD DNase family protein